MPLLTFGSRGDGDGQFANRCDGVRCGPNGTIWVTSFNKVQVFSAEGQFLFRAADRKLSCAVGVAFAANGQVFIADVNEKRIAVCRADGSFVGHIGKGVVGQCHYMAVDDTQGLLYVSEGYGARVSVLTLEGKWVRRLGWTGRDDGEFMSPLGVAVTANGEVGVADHGTARVQVHCALNCFNVCCVVI